MTKSKSIIITIMLLVISTGCVINHIENSERTEQKQTIVDITSHPSTSDSIISNMSLDLSDEDFIVKNKDTYLELGGKYENLITNEKIIRIKYLTENHVYDTYVYENFIISVSPAQNTVSFINIITPDHETYRGIKVGDSISDVFDKYGLVDGNTYEYYYHYKILRFCCDKDGKITNIIFDMI